MIFGALLKINYLQSVPMDIVEYYTGSILFLIGTLIAEASSVSIISKTVSPKLKMSYWNAGLFAGTGDTLGRAIGNALYTIYALKGKVWVPFINYIVVVVMSTLFLIMTGIWIKRLRMHYEIYLEINTNHS